MSVSHFFRGGIVPTTNPSQLPGPEPLTGQHVILERLVEKHFPDLWLTVGSHPDIWIWWPDEPSNTEAEFHEYLKHLLNLSDDMVVYAAVVCSGPNQGQAAGLGMAISKDRNSHRVAELGLFLGPLLQGTRAGTEVPYLISRLLFDSNHRRLQWKTNSLNGPSRKAAERYGFLYEGTFRQDQVSKGRNRDTVMYSIIDSEWPSCQEAFEIWLDAGNFDAEGKQRRKLQEIREGLKLATR